MCKILKHFHESTRLLPVTTFVFSRAILLFSTFQAISTMLTLKFWNSVNNILKVVYFLKIWIEINFENMIQNMCFERYFRIFFSLSCSFYKKSYHKNKNTPPPSRAAIGNQKLTQKSSGGISVIGYSPKLNNL